RDRKVSGGNNKQYHEVEGEYGCLAVSEEGVGHSHQKQKVKCRIIKFYDSKEQREIEFITNDMQLAACTIAEIYKQRWQIELLFKRLKQNLKITSFIRSEEHTSELQSRENLVCRLLLEK